MELKDTSFVKSIFYELLCSSPVFVTEPLGLYLGFEYFEASAKDNINVKQTFERLVDIICEKMSESLDAADPAVTGAKQGPQLTEQPAAPHQDCAC